MRPPPRASLWRNQNFNIFWAGQALSLLGDAFAFIALPLVVLEATGSVAQMGLVTATFGVGQVVAGIFSGTLVDRVDRRKLMIVCDLARAVLYAVIPLTWWLAGPRMWVIFAVTGLGAVLANAFQVANITAVATLVERDRIIEANGRLQATFGLMFLVGPAAAGLISARAGPAMAIGVDALSFVASAVSLLLVRLPRPVAPTSSSAGASLPGEARRGGLEEMLAGARWLIREPVLRSVALLLGAFSFLAAGGLDLFIYHLKSNLGHDDRTVGLVLAIGSAGAIVGAILTPMMRRRWGFAASWLGAGFIQGIALCLFWPVTALVPVIALVMAFTFSENVRGINSMTLRQEITPDHLLGRVTSAFWLMMTVPGPLGAALITRLAERTGAPLTFLIMGLGGIAIGVVGLFTPIRRARAYGTAWGARA